METDEWLSKQARVKEATDTNMGLGIHPKRGFILQMLEYWGIFQTNYRLKIFFSVPLLSICIQCNTVSRLYKRVSCYTTNYSMQKYQVFERS